MTLKRLAIALAASAAIVGGLGAIAALVRWDNGQQEQTAREEAAALRRLNRACLPARPIRVEYHTTISSAYWIVRCPDGVRVVPEQVQ